jgi:META domain/PASTA domain
MNEREATQLLERLGGLIEVPGAPVERVVGTGRLASRRRRRWQMGGVAAAVAIVVAGAGVVAQNSPASDTAPPTSPTTSRGGLISPPGTRLVGENGIVVAVPTSFTTNDIVCAGVGSDTVTFNNDGPWFACAGGDWSATVVNIVDDASPSWPHELYPRSPVHVTVGGTAGGLDQNWCLDDRSGRCARRLAFPTAGVSFTVFSTSRRDLRSILDSAQAVPDGYTTVPSVLGMAGGDAAQTVETAGLTVDPLCAGPQCHASAVGTDPPAGTPVLDGAAVSIQYDPGPTGEAPSEDDLVGTWRPSRIGAGDHLAQVRRVSGSPVVLTFAHLYPWLSWEGYDGCNWTSGRVHLDGGSFNTSQNGTTTRGCLRLHVQPPSIPEIVETAASVTVSGPHLRFYDSDNRLLATFVRDEADAR